jgi:hypothetical protein
MKEFHLILERMIGESMKKMEEPFYSIEIKDQLFQS